MIADGSAQDRVTRFECIEERALRDDAIDLQLDFAVDARKCSQVLRKNDADHGRVCTSTERTAGRSRTIAFQLSPPSGETYTCPPVVPK